MLRLLTICTFLLPLLTGCFDESHKTETTNSKADSSVNFKTTPPPDKSKYSNAKI